MAKRFPPQSGGMKSMMKQMEKLQKDLKEKEDKVKSEIFETSSGGGVVNLKINGNKEIVELKIDPDIVDPDDIETLQDLIIAAVNEGIKKAEEEMNKVMGSMTQGLNIPGLF